MGSQASGEAGRADLITERADGHVKVTLKSPAGFQQAPRGWVTDLEAKEQVKKVHTFLGNGAIVVAEQTTPGDRDQKLYRVWPSSGEMFMGSAEFGKLQSPLSQAAGGASGNLVPMDWEGDSQGCTQPWFIRTVGSGLSTWRR